MSHDPFGGPRLTRRQLLWMAPAAAAGVASAAAIVGRRPLPPSETLMRAMGSGPMLAIKRGHDPTRAGQIQIVPQPGSTVVRGDVLAHDVRSSHPLPWQYARAIPLVLYGPGFIRPGSSGAPVSLADLAPTYARLLRFGDFDAPDGHPLPEGVDLDPDRPPKAIVTIVIDGGGWNALARWPKSWPNLARLRADGLSYDKATTGAAPAVTAVSHATIGTGAFPRRHGISGHWIRSTGGIPHPAYRNVADPTALRLPTLGDLWGIHTDGRAWMGLVGYQDWHLGMLGHGTGWPGGTQQYLSVWDETAPTLFSSLGSDLYRTEDGLVKARAFERYLDELDAEDGSRDGRFFGKARVEDVSASTWPVVRYTGDLVEALIRHEGIGRQSVPSLLFVNFKAPDYAGHTFSMNSIEERAILKATDDQIGRIRAVLDDVVGDGSYVLAVTADHGQCPLPDDVGGLKIGKNKLEGDLESVFGRQGDRAKLFPLVQPGEVFVDEEVLARRGLTLSAIADYLNDYTLRDNTVRHRPKDTRPAERMDDPVFAAALTSARIKAVSEAEILAFGRRIWAGIRNPLGISRSLGSTPGGDVGGGE